MLGTIQQEKEIEKRCVRLLAGRGNIYTGKNQTEVKEKENIQGEGIPDYL